MRRFERLYTFSFLPLIVAFLGIGFSLLVAWRGQHWIEKTETARFNTASEQITFLIQKKLDEQVQLLRSAAALLVSSSTQTQQKWQIFSEINNLEKNFPGLQVLGFAPLIHPSQREAHEAKMRQEGMKEYTVFPLVSDIADMFPITYLEPFTEHNRKALGFNMASEESRKKAIYAALKRGEAALSSKVELIQEQELLEKAGFVIYMPMYQLKMPLNTEEERMRAAKGVLVSAMKVKDLFRDILGAKYILIDFEIYDGQSPNEQSLLYNSNQKLTEPRLEKYTIFEFYGKKWTLYFKANEALDVGTNRFLPYLQLFFGTTFSIILSAWFYALQRTRKRAYEIADEKTRQLRRSEAETRSIFQAMSEGILVFNAQGVMIECNLAAQDMLKCNANEMLGIKNSQYPWTILDENKKLLNPEETPLYKALYLKETQNGVVLAIERADATLLWVLSNAQAIYADDFEEVISVVVTFSDITELSYSKHTLERYLKIIDKHVIVSSTDCKGIITESSEAFCNISGYSKSELRGRNHNIVRHEDFPASVYEQMWKKIKDEKDIWEGEILNRSKDGSNYWVNTIIEPRYDQFSTLIGYTAIRQDITDKKRIEELSITDRLTGLYNRLKLDELFAFHISVAKRHKSAFSIIILDIDKFKSVNDTYGHQAGDTVLKKIALILKENCRLEDTLGRWGGEEFLILLPSSDLDSGIALAQKLRAKIEAYVFDKIGVCTASFGVSSFHEGDNEQTMVSRADLALYRAKESGRNKVEAEVLE